MMMVMMMMMKIFEYDNNYMSSYMNFNSRFVQFTILQL